jgi:hypothetical protein
MTPLVFLLVSCAGCLAVVVRGRLSRFEQVGVALFIVVVACLAVGGLLSTTLRGDDVADGRALIPCVIGPLLALSWRTALTGRTSGPLVGVLATVLLLAGLGSHAAALVPWRGAPLAVTAALSLAVVAAVAAAIASLRRARDLPAALWRQRLVTEAAGVGVVGLAALLAAVGTMWSVRLDAAWPALVALGAALATSARASAWPLMGRDVVIGAGAALAAVIVAPPDPTALVAAAAALTGVVVGQGLLSLPSRRPARSEHRAGSAAAPTGLFGMAPIVDDDLLRRPLRPRVLARTSTRRIVDAAIDRAWRGVGQGRGRPPIDVVGGDDIDVDGDAGELAEAICAVLDSALRGRTDPAAGRIIVTLRAAPTTVSVEVDDVALALPPHPFLDDAGHGGAVALARARVLIERHGGQLHVRRGERSAVHLTLPRRVQRGPIGIA